MDPVFDWSKILSPGEDIRYEGGYGKHYLNMGFAICIFTGIILSLLFVGIIIIIWAFFYWKFYLVRSFRYALTNRRLLVHRGWLSTKLISIDYDKITDIEIKEEFLEKKIFQTATILINTAGTTFHEVIIDKIPNAFEFKQQLEFIKQSE